MRIGGCLLALLLLGACSGGDWSTFAGDESGAHILPRRGGDVRPAGSATLAFPHHADSFMLATGLGQVHLVQLVHDGAAASRDLPLVIYCADRDFDADYDGAAVAETLSPHGDVLMFEYPGNGQSDGAWRAEELHALVRSLSAMVQMKAASRPVIFWGRGIGAGVCAALAAATPLASRLVLMPGGETQVPGYLVAPDGGGKDGGGKDGGGKKASQSFAVVLAGYDGAILVAAGAGAGGDNGGETIVAALRQSGKKVRYVPAPPGGGLPQ